MRTAWVGSRVNARGAGAIALAVLVAVVLAGCAPPAGTQGQSTSTVAPTPIPNSDEVSEFQAAAATISRVVVNVEIEKQFDTPRGPQLIPTGNGSGVVIRSDGYILTNDHVVADADNLDVDVGTAHLAAKVVGRDPSTDLAVIKIERTGMPAADFGDPATLKLGEWVIAVGSPFGLDHTVTTGIVSALNRSTVSQGGGSAAAYTNLIQTDAAINPGNSGGALGTLNGKVIGINSITESPSGSSTGVGFAIPIDFAMSVATQLIKTGHALHPYLGVNVTSVDEHVALELGLTGTIRNGALVQQVLPRSPALAGGVRVDDIITKIGETPVTDAATFWEGLRAQKIGATVPIDVYRAGKTVTLNVTLGSGRQG